MDPCDVLHTHSRPQAPSISREKRGYWKQPTTPHPPPFTGVTEIEYNNFTPKKAFTTEFTISSLFLKRHRVFFLLKSSQQYIQWFPAQGNYCNYCTLIDQKLD